MKITKALSVLAASAVAAASLAVSVSAYDLNKDLKTGWSVSITVPGEEFEDATPDSVFTLTFTADASLAEKDGHNYWCVKPMINDTGWPFIDNLVGPALSDGGDSYPVDPEATEMKFTIPAEELEHLQEAGMAFMGHGVTLGTLTFSNSETLPAATTAAETTAAPVETEPEITAAETAAEETTAAVTEAAATEAPAAETTVKAVETTAAETKAADPTPAKDVEAAADTTAATVTTTAASGNGNPATGVDDLVGCTVAMLISGGVMVLSRKRA